MTKMKPVRKAVFPVAGLGTRFLPATKAMPKEMLPVVDKPLIQYAVEEAAAAGITDMIFITGRHKRAIEDHFDSAPELERDLKSKNKNALLATLKAVVPPGINFILSVSLNRLDWATQSCAPSRSSEKSRLPFCWLTT